MRPWDRGFLCLVSPVILKLRVNFLLVVISQNLAYILHMNIVNLLSISINELKQKSEKQQEGMEGPIRMVTSHPVRALVCLIH